MTRQNLTFRGAAPTWANACVGDNGSPSYVEYARGFSKAANILTTIVLENHSTTLTTDEFVYPICFNMRHSIELRLKGAIESLQILATLKGERLPFNLKDTHDLNKLWSFFRTESARIDNRFLRIASQVNDTITDIADVDPTGQTFRYPFNTKSVKHLADVSLINFAVLLHNFTELEKGLEDLLNLYEWLIEEYNHSNLKEIQRNIIFAIARKLPKREDWSNRTFNDIKTQLREEFSLSSNQLTKAINLIENDYFLSQLIGIEKPLLGIRAEQIELFVAAWMVDNADLKQHPRPEQDEEDTSLLSSANLAEFLRRPRADWKSIEHIATPESTAGLHALFYFAYDFRFSEYYTKIYDQNLREMSIIANNSPEELTNELRHIFEKANFIYHLIQSLYILGHASLAEKIIAEHEIEHAISWLSEARKGQLLEYPVYAQYP